MISDKELKQTFKIEIKQNYDKYFPVKKLNELGFSRYSCGNCGKDFWSSIKRERCGEPECVGGYSFIKNKTDVVDFIEVWKRFSVLFKKMGYTPIKRYPSVARWNPTMDFTLASIADFQPYVVSGEVEPPANPLIVPQTCIRFNDIDNVGITGRHYTGFTMIGQHAFMPKEKFNQEKYFEDYYQWYIKGMKLKPEDFVIHEDSWAGGGNFGPCLEFFSKGLEIGNQVYMLYEITPEGKRELKLKVLDMGKGQERPSWYLSGTPTSYEVNFPTVCKYLFKSTGIKPDNEIMKRFFPVSGLLNVDETDNINLVWKNISKSIGYDVEKIKQTMTPLAAIYSLGDHTRTLLYTISDGALPSNVKGGYNLRVLFRRIHQFLEKYNWNIDINKLIEMHATYLKPQYPELSENLELVKKILAVEYKKYLENKKRSSQIISQLLSKEKIIDEKTLLKLYDSDGINPELVEKEAEARKIEVRIPDNFYSKIAELHEKAERKAEEENKILTKTEKQEKYELDDVSETTILYYEHYDLVDFAAYVAKVFGNKVVLDQTAFFPTSGGQIHDKGTIDGINVVDVFKQGNIVIHQLETVADFKKGQKVRCHIDINRRMQLAQHHSAAHILNGSARKILGEHIWQAGASKTPEKARLDITHYDNLTQEEIKKIEELSNEIIKKNLPIMKSFMARNLAEKNYGFRIYQGGAVPGKKLRIVEIPGHDVEACGGTHLDVTGDVYKIKIIKTTKIQDGVIRLEFVAGAAAERYSEKTKENLDEISELLDCIPSQIPGRANELFEKWKTANKAIKKSQKPEPKVFKLSSSEEFKGDVLQETANILKTQKEHVAKTIKRFLDEMDKIKKDLNM